MHKFTNCVLLSIMKKQLVDEKVREEIIIASEKVFQSYGLEKVSMQDISKACGRSRTSLYHYFKNKMEVFDAIGDRKLSKILQSCSQQISNTASLADNLEAFQKQKMKELRTLAREFDLVLRDLRHDPSLLVIKFRVQFEEEIAVFDKMINWAIDKQEIRPLSKENSRFLAETFVTALKSFEQEIILFDRFPEFETKLSWLASIFTKGLQ